MSNKIRNFYILFAAMCIIIGLVVGPSFHSTMAQDVQATETPTETASTVDTSTLTPTELPSQTLTATLSETPTASMTATETATLTPTLTADAEATSEVTLEPTVALLETATATLTETFINETPTASPLPMQTNTPTPHPFGPEPPMQLIFSDNFDAGETLLWSLGNGWTFVPSEGGQGLQVTNSDEPVTFANNNVLDAAVEIRFQMTDGMVRFTTRQSDFGSYTTLVDTSGKVILYRGGEIIGASFVPGITANTWHTLRLSAVGSIVRVMLNGVEIITLQDTVPLPSGTVSFAWFGADTGKLIVDDFNLFIMETFNRHQTETVLATPNDPPTPTPTALPSLSK